MDENKLSASVIQVFVIAVCLVVFAYVRHSRGVKARFITHFAWGYAVMVIMYSTYPVFGAILGRPTNYKAVFLWRVLDSSLSFCSSAFMITAYLLLKDFRLELEQHFEKALRTPSRDEITRILIALMLFIGPFIGLVHLMNQDSLLLGIFSFLDAACACIAYILVGWEFSRMRLDKDPNEGSFFVGPTSHRCFAWLTFSVFLLWGVAQFGYLKTVEDSVNKPVDAPTTSTTAPATSPASPAMSQPSTNPAITQTSPGPITSTNPSSNTSPLTSQNTQPGRPSFWSLPDGGLYMWLAILKLLAGLMAAILTVHALPSVLPPPGQDSRGWA